MLRTESFDRKNEYAQRLVEERVPSRMAARDASLFSFDDETEEFVGNFFGWTTLASKPPFDPAEINAFAAEVRAECLKAVVLIGQGGSTQASMTLTKLNALVDESIAFKTMDSLSPVYVNKILRDCDPCTTLYLVASKSGSTVEPTYLSRIVWEHVCKTLGAEAAAKRFVAISDPGSLLEQEAKERGWRKVFPGLADVGGRFSAMSVFGLLPAALVGIDIEEVLYNAAQTEALCCTDSLANPAVTLASFLYENYEEGRDKFCLVSPQPGRVFGLWVEQLVAESLGKDGEGILPNIEIDASMLAIPRDDRCAITYAIHPDASFESDISRIDPSIPTIHCEIPYIGNLASHFVLWEYAVAFTATLLEVNPFDQPNVQTTKTKVKDMLCDLTSIGKTEGCMRVNSDHAVVLECEVTPATYKSANNAMLFFDDALKALFTSITPGDYFSVCAFLPFYKEGRRIPLEEIRHVAAAHLGVVSCLEIGPRYLHSTGQLHKGGKNNGVFLILSSEEEDDIMIPGEGFSLGTLAHAQACGDMAALAQNDRRALRLHLANNDPKTLANIAARICSAACRIAYRR